MGQPIKFAHLNVHHSEAAMLDLGVVSIDKSIDLVSINEAYVRKGKTLVPGDFSVVHSPLPDFRVAFWVSRRISHCVITAEKDCVAIRVSLRRSSLLVITCYCAPSEDMSSNLQRLEAVLQRYHMDPVVLVGDFNAKSYIWGNRPTDPRGTALISFASSMNLEFMNDPDSPPIYSSRLGASWVDMAMF